MRLSQVWPVELGREESRGRLQDLVRPPQLSVLLPQPDHLGIKVLTRSSRWHGALALVTTDPVPQRRRVAGMIPSFVC